MKKYSKYLFLIVLAAFVVAGCTHQPDNQDENQPVPNTQEAVNAPGAQNLPTQEELRGETDTDSAQTNFAFTATESGQTAFQLLQEEAEITYDEADFGVFVTGVNGVTADEDHYWALYLNEEYATKGVVDLELQQGDVIELRLEEIE